MRSVMFKVLDFAIRILTKVRNRFAPPEPRLYRVLQGFRRYAACKAVLGKAFDVELRIDPAYNARTNSDAYDIAAMRQQIMDGPWSVEDILRREG